MYLKNPIVPGHIPFDVIIEEFTTFAVQNSSDRYGNNQAAIIQQFNNWIKKAEVQHKLTALRDQRYPEKAPAKLKESNPTVKIEDLTTQALKQRIESMLPFEGLKTVDAMIAEYRAELDRRGSYE